MSDKINQVIDALKDVIFTLNHSDGTDSERATLEYLKIVLRNITSESCSKLKWSKWIGVDNIPLNKTLLVEIEGDYRTAVFTKKNGVICGKINGAFWFDQPILQWADLEGVL